MAGAAFHALLPALSGGISLPHRVRSHFRTLPTLGYPNVFSLNLTRRMTLSRRRRCPLPEMVEVLFVLCPTQEPAQLPFGKLSRCPFGLFGRLALGGHGWITWTRSVAISCSYSLPSGLCRLGMPRH